ncbi:MAG: hypothetical protein ABIV63_19775 [Caldimonas sp.]
MMHPASRKRFLGEAGLGVLCAVLAVMTVVWPDWIEEAFGFDIDQHSGELEWLIAIALALCGVVSGLFARMEWRRLAKA